MPTEKRHSYGIIPLHKSDHGTEVLMVQHAPDVGGHWSFPKGTPEEVETPIETARREVFEETGLTFEEIDETKTFSEEYTFEKDGKIIEKTTTYFVGYVQSKDFVVDGTEIERAAWIPIKMVEEILTYPVAKRIWNKVRLHVE